MAAVRDFARKFDLVLKAFNLSRGRLAQTVGIDKSVVSRWASGATVPTDHNLSLLTQAVMRHKADFGRADWDLDVEAFAARLGVAAHAPAASEALPSGPAAPAREQRIAFCRASDGVRLAYATVGAGPPIVKTANWLNHLEYDWESPIYRGLFRGLAAERTLVRYDARGNGLSDWEVGRIDFEAFVTDLETVMDAAGIKRAPVFCMSQGCAVAVAYAVRHPERVSHLILHGGFAVGPLRRSPEVAEQTRAMMHLIRTGWGTDNPAFRQMFTSLFFPDGTKEVFDSFNELQRICISPENAFRIREAVGNIDVRDLLPKVKVPTLVTHSRGDAVASWELGRAMAAEIPGARFVTLQSKNHALLDGEPAHARLLDEIGNFLAD
ncbi:alpha/beta fold hydrolase [Reyranella aquatilis]|uniref:Alpha/beta fold hydrolase n=1 Tax=Reyranella aquatilis TaxID=2035356 RepID=A0ABS8KW87_9HYPH|nr:alpha/beta fold hydrolase [Reyranella aquatilis]MCC8430305.1 alpha/beta fold hydrolase [Reyranella aquatilis]